MSLTVKRYKHLPAGLCHSILAKVEPTIYDPSDIFDQPPLNSICALRRRVQFALAVSEEDSLPTDHLSYRFEKGFYEYCLLRYNSAGKRLAKLPATQEVAYYRLAGSIVTVLVPVHKDGAQVQITLTGIGADDEWTIENNTSYKAELVSHKVGEQKGLAKKFIDLNRDPDCFYNEGGVLIIKDCGLPAWCTSKELPKGVRSMFWSAKEQAEEARAKAKAKATPKSGLLARAKKASNNVT